MWKNIRIFSIIFLILSMVVLAGCGQNAPAASTPTPSNPDLILATTTSTQDSGLLDVLIPMFEQKTGYKVKTVAKGTGAALALGQKGEADVMLTHAPSSEQPLVDDKTAVNYQLIMHNDFIIVGPANDPAGVKKAATLKDVFQAISDTRSIFISRGDKSGTDTKEKDLWKKAEITPNGSWYQESGVGMGQTLNIASQKAGYTLTDRATYLANKKNLQLEILREGNSTLLNIYHVMQVNSEKFPKVNKDGAKAFVDFMTSTDTQKTIGEFGKDKYGQALFFPDYGKKIEDLGK
jgi:ABC-type tungstate transport system, permease component